MRVVLQRVKRAALTADGVPCAAIGPGLVAYVGIGPGDDDTAMRYILDKIWNLRVFEDEQEKLNLSVKDLGRGAVCLQFYSVRRLPAWAQTQLFVCGASGRSQRKIRTV